MFHYIKGKVKNYNKQFNEIIIQNEIFGIQAFYTGDQTNTNTIYEFFLHPYINDNKKTINYFAFDSIKQKISFTKILKVNGVGPKTAFQISKLSTDKLELAIKTLDSKLFQSIPGIGPKSAKKILLELKGNYELEDVQQMDIDQKLYKNIVNSLKSLGYDVGSIKSKLQKYDGKITNENMTKVIKRIISEM